MLRNIKIKNPSILLLGVSCKKNVDDDEESPAFKIMKLLKEKNIKFQYNDPYFPVRKEEILSFLKIYFTKQKEFKKFDAILVVTDHDLYDYKFIYENSKKFLMQEVCIKISIFQMYRIADEKNYTYTN